MATTAHANAPVERAIALARGHDFVDDFDWGFESVDGLSVVDAWAMATQWSSALGPRVSLSQDITEKYQVAVVPHYAWVKVAFGVGASGGRGATVARAASLVWRALAACRGYSPSDHPVFWKRLFSELKATFPDGYDFFEGVTFPRFMVDLWDSRTANTKERMIRIFCGVETVDDCGDVERQLNESLDCLAPFVQKCYLERPIELTAQIVLKKVTEARISALIDEIQAAPSGTSDDLLRRPSYVVISVRIRSRWPYMMTGIPLYVGQTLDPVVVKGDMSTDRMDHLATRDFLLWALRVGKTSGGVANLEITRWPRRSDNAPAICSALPHTRCLQTFQFCWFGSESDHPRDIAWLGYALFHPETTSSTWRKLYWNQHSSLSTTARRSQASSTWTAFAQIVMTKFDRFRYGSTNHSSCALQLMAQGNNLAVALGVSRVVVDAYYTATIRAGAVILKRKHDVDSDAGAVDIESILMVLDEPTQLDVCVTSPDVTSLDKYVFVIVAGYGNGWVHSKSIESIVSRPPGRSSLTALRVGGSGTSSDLGTVRSVLPLVGESLESLHLEYEVDYTRVMDLLTADSCPKLQSLRLSVSTDYRYTFHAVNYKTWVGWMFPPGLRTLYVRGRPPTTGSILRFDESPLQELKDLVTMHMATSDPLTDQAIREFIQPLFCASPRLQRFVWGYYNAMDQEIHRPARLSYAQIRFLSRVVVLSDLMQHHGDSASHAPLESIVALLSAVRSHYYGGGAGGRSALGQLDRDLVLLISSFVGINVPRQLWLAGCG